MSNSDAPQTFKSPLPLRKSEVSGLQRTIEDGVVLVPENKMEHYDMANAAQALVIERLATDLVADWQRPKLECTQENFHTVFAKTYFDTTGAVEAQLWSELLDEVSAKVDVAASELTPLEAAVLTLALLSGYEKQAVASGELFGEVALHGQAYETKLRERLGSNYTNEVLYENIRAHFPRFLTRFIAMDSVVIDLYRYNATTDQSRPYTDNPLNPGLFHLDDNNALSINRIFIEELKKHAAEHKFTKDFSGRDVNRGCPFLRADNYPVLITFAIEEFIAQHKQYFSN